MAVMSIGGILMIAFVVFAIYGVFHLLFAGHRPVEPAPTPTMTSSTPEWLTPVVLAGLMAFGFSSRMPWWIVVFGALFAVMMLVKFGVLSFAKPTQPAAPVPPPLPREPRLQNATYHPTLQPPPQSTSGFGGAAMFATVLLVVGLTVLGVAVVHEDRVQPPRHLELVVAESWKDAGRISQQQLENATAEMKRGMAEMKQEFHSGKGEFAQASKVVAEVFEKPQVPPTGAPQVASPAITPSEQDRIKKALGQDRKKTSVGKNKKPKAPPAPVPPQIREPAVEIPFDKSPTDLADLPPTDSPNGVYVVMTDPKDHLDDFHAAFERAKALFKNHMKLHHGDVDENALNIPTFAWCEANGLIHKRYERRGNLNVVALGTNFSERAMDLAYNYHLGVERTRDAAKGYFGGLLVLGGLGLLLRIGTGVRPTAPVARA